MNSDKININTEALIPATKLRNNNLQKRSMKEIITDVIKQISQELVLAHREGRHDITTSIPITYAIPNMSNADGQRVVYATIIEELIEKGYRIWINPGKNECRIKITWMSPADENELHLQNALIAKHTKKI
jgi:hypothetical protein